MTEFDPEILKRASDGGIIFIAIDDEGNRSVVGVDEVKEPVNDDKPFIVVQPVYVDDRVKAVVDVFDALAASVPAVAASAEVQPVSSKARSAMSFAQALEALRKLAHPDSEEGGAQ
ncbi:hypothetical protein [Enorma massiliensis]|uniref:hypothetical protein n=1 Tax=Enorma massiliensis TaxID=1472761 RepID=UPI003AF02139